MIERKGEIPDPDFDDLVGDQGPYDPDDEEDNR